MISPNNHYIFISFIIHFTCNLLSIHEIKHVNIIRYFYVHFSKEFRFASNHFFPYIFFIFCTNNDGICVRMLGLKCFTMESCVFLTYSLAVNNYYTYQTYIQVHVLVFSIYSRSHCVPLTQERTEKKLQPGHLSRNYRSHNAYEKLLMQNIFMTASLSSNSAYLII